MITIGFIGAPGAGKSTLAYGLVYGLKKSGYEVELVPELIKQRVMNGLSNDDPDVNVLNGIQQKNLELQYRRLPLDFLVCETTLINPLMYGEYYRAQQYQIDYLKVLAIESQYDIIYRVMFRPQHVYHTFGRCESEKQARDLDVLSKVYLTKYHKNHVYEITSDESLETMIAEVVKFRRLI